MAGGAALDPTFVLAELVRAPSMPTAAQLPGLVAGAQIMAVLIGRDGIGRTIVRTEFGQIALARLVDAPRGSVLTLEVHETGGRLVVGIRAVSPPAAGEAARLATARPQPAATAEAKPTGAIAPAIEVLPRVVFAVVDEVQSPAVRFAGAVAATVAGMVQGRDRDGRTLVRIGQGTLVLATMGVPLEPGTPVTITAAPGAEPRAVLVTPAGRPQASPDGGPATADSTAHATFAPATRAVVEALRDPRGAAGAPTLLPWLQPGTSLVAVVAGPDGAGRPSIDGPWGTLRLAGSAAPPPGTPVAVEVLDVGAGLFVQITPLAEALRPLVAQVVRDAHDRSGGATGAPPPRPDAVPGTPGPASPPGEVDDIIDIGRWLAQPLPLPAPAPPAGAPRDTLERWPVLADLIRTLVRVAPEAALRIIDRLPKPDANLAPAIARFAAMAAQAPGTASWFGAAAAEAMPEAERLTLDREIERLVAPSADPAGRVLTFPLLAPWGLLMAGLFVGGDGAADPPDDRAHRFIVELDLPVSGHVQLDGLVHGPRLDLVVRTPGAMPASLGDILTASFHAGCRAAALDGAIRFQIASCSPVAVHALARSGPPRRWTA